MQFIIRAFDEENKLGKCIEVKPCHLKKPGNNRKRGVPA